MGPTGNSAFVYAHGGAGIMLSAEENLNECYRYAVDWHCIVFSVNYRNILESIEETNLVRQVIVRKKCNDERRESVTHG